jgi:radical SAM superfamily enzyme YgiQ (UPF0313 family)
LRILFLVHDVITVPLGISYLASISERAGHEVFALALRDPALVSRARDIAPDILAFGCTTGYHRTYLEVVGELRESIGVPVVMGGAHATFFPEELEKNPFVDFLVRGEADEAFPQLLEALEGRRGMEAVGNLRYRSGDAIIENPLLPLVDDLDTVPFPKRDLLKGYKSSTSSRAVFVITGRGCPYDCTYCFNHSMKKMYSGLGRYVRRRSVGNVIAELKQLRSSMPGLQMIVFQDDTFVLDRDWVMEFCRVYPAEIGLMFHCHLRANCMDDELAQALADAGCFSVKMAVETVSEHLRNDVLGRNMSLETIEGACRAVKKAGIRLVTQNILCIPGSTAQDDMDTLALNARIRPAFAFATLLQPYPRTEIAEYCIREGFMPAGTSEPDTPDSFFDASVLEVPDKKRRERLRKLFALAVEFAFVRRSLGFLCSLPLNGFYDLLDKVWKGYCIKEREFPFKLTAAEYARDVISYFRSRYY